MDDIKYVVNWFKMMGVSEVILSGENAISENNLQRCISFISDLEQLKKIEESVESGLKETANNMVFGTGNPNSKIVFVGEAPGAEEDKQGIPFVGQAGKLLDKAIQAIGMDRTSVYITNVIPWRPLGNRTPTTDEIALYRPFLIRHINIINPKVVVCLGSSAARAILQSDVGISKIRGHVMNNNEIFENPDIKIVATFHPAYLLRSPLQKKEVWRDFLLIKTIAHALDFC